TVALVIDIKSVGSAAAGEDASGLWQRLRERLTDKQVGVLTRQSSEKPRELVRLLREWIAAKPERKLLVMFDEADNFLDADSKSGFRDVTLLRDLMNDTNRRFKVVFTGLHNVQRFNGIPNQPLAHFGGIQIGPLEPDAAYELIKRPFERLGYRFEEPGTILRILSYTNYHPGLIQLFCHALLERLHQSIDTDPPYTVRQLDVEAVYRDSTVQRSITERLDWTLALDMRYQAIAWSLVYDQSQSADGYARAYPPAELLRLLRQNWAQGFEPVMADELRGLLDEMQGLGILVRDAEGQYRLRSPNLVRLMGSEDDIFERLAELSRQQAPIVFDADSHHASLEGSYNYSPLTHAQERRLATPQFGVALIFANRALGWTRLPEALARMIRDRAGDSCLNQIPSTITMADQLVPWLRHFVDEHQNIRRMIVYQEVTAADPFIEERIDAAIQFCRERSKTKNRFLRIVFLFNAEATSYWVSINGAARDKLEQLSDAVVFPARWNRQGIRQLLDQHQKLGSEDAQKVLLSTTGGWMTLIDTVFTRGRSADDLRVAAGTVDAALGDVASGLRQNFRAELEIEQNIDALALMRAIDTLGGVPVDALTPDLVDVKGLTEERLTAACELLLRLGCLERDDSGTLRAEPVAARVLFA
ncbi:MAG TPA: hypothetical protein VFA59_16390, partial [Vicinamibacterales bacterium]|nr:hypothetical protein [Vicinamibacterales bacterium]